MQDIQLLASLEADLGVLQQRSWSPAAIKAKRKAIKQLENAADDHQIARTMCLGNQGQFLTHVLDSMLNMLQNPEPPAIVLQKLVYTAAQNGGTDMLQAIASSSSTGNSSGSGPNSSSSCCLLEVVIHVCSSDKAKDPQGAADDGCRPFLLDAVSVLGRAGCFDHLQPTGAMHAWDCIISAWDCKSPTKASGNVAGKWMQCRYCSRSIPLRFVMGRAACKKLLNLRLASESLFCMLGRNHAAWAVLVFATIPFMRIGLLERLMEQGCPRSCNLISAAAGANHKAVLQWLKLGSWKK